MDSQNLNGNPNGKKLMWMYVAAVIIVALVIFFIYSALKTNPNGGSSLSSASPSVSQDADITNLESQGSSDNVADIAKDLNATDLSGLDSDLQNIDNSLK